MQTRRQEKIGIVSGTKMQKTVVVTVERQVMHPLYKRVVRRSKRFLAHDERNECQLGDMVRIAETRPLSRRKRWRIIQIIAKSPQVGRGSEDQA